jgi:hypothetical protein
MASTVHQARSIVASWRRLDATDVRFSRLPHVSIATRERCAAISRASGLSRRSRTPSTQPSRGCAPPQQLLARRRHDLPERPRLEF